MCRKTLTHSMSLKGCNVKNTFNVCLKYINLLPSDVNPCLRRCNNGPYNVLLTLVSFGEKRPFLTESAFVFGFIFLPFTPQIPLSKRSKRFRSASNDLVYIGLSRKSPECHLATTGARAVDTLFLSHDLP